MCSRAVGLKPIEQFKIRWRRRDEKLPLRPGARTVGHLFGKTAFTHIATQSLDLPLSCLYVLKMRSTEITAVNMSATGME